jgi:glycosyltransferase involved in cell wall biosynthesis
MVLAPYPLGTVPGQRFRFEEYLDALAAEGIDMDTRPLLDKGTMKILYEPGHLPRKAGFLVWGALRRLVDVLRARRYDAVLVYREAFPVGPPLFEWLLRRLGVPYVFDFDDAVYLTNTSAANRLAGRLKYAGKTDAIAAGATLVTAGNPYLADWARKLNANVRVLPTTIDLSTYTPRAGESDGPLTIGWSGSMTTVEYLYDLAPVLARLQREEGVRLRVIGAEDFRIEGAEVEALPWREATEVEDLRAIDIGLMPAPDDEWARSKCGLKGLQYMALAIPTVFAPVGVNTEIAQDGAALLAATPDQWFEVLRGLVRDPAERARLAEAGRRRVEERYSLEGNVALWADAYRSTANRKFGSVLPPIEARSTRPPGVSSKNR